MKHSRTFTAGLGICVLLGMLDIVGLAGFNTDAPPATVVIIGALLGVITLAGAAMAWQHKRGGIVTVVGVALLPSAPRRRAALAGGSR